MAWPCMATGMSCRTNGMMWVLIKIGTNGQRPQNWSVLLLNHSIRQQVLSHTMVSQVYIICPMFISFSLAKACKDSGTSTAIDTGIFVWPFHAQRYLKLHRPPDPYDGGDLLALWSLDSGVEDLDEYRRSAGDFRSEVQMHWMGLYLPPPYRTCL